MAAALRTSHDATITNSRCDSHDDASSACLDALSTLGSVAIETSLLANLSDDLHTLFDPVSEDVLPIYFGPLLGRLYLEGL